MGQHKVAIAIDGQTLQRSVGLDFGLNKYSRGEADSSGV